MTYRGTSPLDPAIPTHNPTNVGLPPGAAGDTLRQQIKEESPMRSAPALGIPGSATTAVMLAAFQLLRTQPRPMVFAERRELVWG